MISEIRGTVAIETHGCKLNQADSEALALAFATAGYQVIDPSEEADIYIVNTCTVTHVADRKARKSLRSAKHSHPPSFVVATGCYAQRAPAVLKAMPEINLVVGNAQKHQLVEMVLALKGDAPVPCATGEELSVFPGAFGRTRASIKIQEGCNQVCAYCIVPKVRGRERSVPIEVLVQQVQKRVHQGFKEVVLTGTQLGSYGYDLPNVSLASLIKQVLTRTDVPRLRVSSLQPQELTDDLLALWDDPRLCPHFHIPLQSGCDSVLKRMRRRYTTELYSHAVARVRTTVPCVSITADVIVGFPGETEEEFQASLDSCRRMGFASMHVFPYSIRPGTSAAYMRPHVEEAVKRHRTETMLSLARESEQAYLNEQAGSVRPVLWERMVGTNGFQRITGLTDNYIKVVAPMKHRREPSLMNNITQARLVRPEGDTMLAEVLSASQESLYA